jgi:HEAT repeat protein
MSLSRYLQEIAKEERPLRYGALVALSSMSRAEMERFAETWRDLSPQRQRQLLSRLVEMAEENVELDYNSIFLMCLRSPDSEVREKAILGLWEFEDRSLIGPLLEILSTDVDPKVRSVAAVALGKFAILAAEGKLSAREADRIENALLDVLKSERECTEVRRRTLEAAAPFNTHTVQEFIRRSYESDDLNLRCSALHAMGRTGEPRWLRYLLRELRSPSPALRFEATSACAELGGESSVPHIVPLLDDDDPQVQIAAVRALGEIGGVMATRALRRCLRSDDLTVQEAARQALDEIEVLENPLSFHYRI